MAISLGGTKLAVVRVNECGPIQPKREGDPWGGVGWRSEFKITYGPEDQGNEPVRAEAERRLMKGIVQLVGSAVNEARKDGKKVAKIGVATKGPIKKGSDNDGEYVVVGPCTTLPFKECKLDRELKNRLKECNKHILIEVLHDGAAAALGEMNYAAAERRKEIVNGDAGAHSTTDHMAAVIIGTGVGVGALKNRKDYHGIDPEQEGNAYERNLGSLGRHLVCVARSELPVPGHWPEYCRYQYRGADPRTKYAPISKQSGEAYFTERVAGPWLAKEIARLLKEYSQDNPRDALYTRAAMQVIAPDVDRLLSLEREDEEKKALQKKILAGLTWAAQAGDAWARYQIGAIGAEIGGALAQFILAFRDREFVRRIILVSTVSEKLGHDVADKRNHEFEKNENDLLMARLRTAAEAVLSANGMPQDKASEQAGGISRSNLGGERELWAFAPVPDDP